MLCLKGAEPKLGLLTGTGLQFRLPPCGWSDGGGRGRVSCLGTLAVVWKGPSWGISGSFAAANVAASCKSGRLPLMTVLA